MKIIYKSETDTAGFDKNRYLESLNKYGKVTAEQVDEGLKEFEGYDPLSYTCLIELGVQLLPDEDSARAYYEDHKVEGEMFMRLIRTTGYLTGDYRRSNDAKIAEYAARVVHGTTGKDGVFSKDDKDAKECVKLAYAGIAADLESGKV